MRALIMGILNVTPDSFSDGGRWLDPDAAVAHGLDLFGQGADIVDVGGESTRPGAQPVPVDEERRRVIPVVEALASGGRVSVDTRHREVAEAAIGAGATIVNDVTASLGAVAGAAGAGFVAMHMQGDPTTMQLNPRYDDVVAEVTAFLVERAEQARADGATEVWIDPGIGFGKTMEHNLALLAGLPALVDTGWPVAVGVSRKGFLGRLTGVAEPADRLAASVAAASWALVQGVSMIRVHDVAATRAAVELLAAEVAA